LSAVVVPGWLAEIVRPRRAPVPWPEMARAALAICVPLSVSFAAGRGSLGVLPATGGLLGTLADAGGPYLSRVKRVCSAAVFGGAAGLAIGAVTHGHGWLAVVALVAVAGVSGLLSARGDIGSVTGLQLLVYTSLGAGPIGALRPVWHTAAGFLIGVVWALILILPGWLHAPYGREQRDVAAVYDALAGLLRSVGGDEFTVRRQALTGALNTAYDELLTARSTATGLNRRRARLLGVLNASHLMAEAAVAVGLTGTRPPARSRMRRSTYRALADLRAEFQRTMSEPPSISRRATAWWPAVVALEQVMDAGTATALAVSRGAQVSPSGVRQLSDALRAVSEAAATGSALAETPELPDDETLRPVTDAVRALLGVLGTGERLTC
jgi:uncharacterized membrane protein YccC